MKTYILTEEDVQRLKEEFCISKLQADTFDEMFKGFTQFVEPVEKPRKDI